MTWLLLVIFGCVSIGMVLWGLLERERVFQYPFLAGSAWAFYILPQLVGLVRGQEHLPHAVIAGHGLEMALFMSILCALMGWWGFRRNPFGGWARRPLNEYSNRRLFYGGCALIAVGFYGMSGLASLSGGYVEYFSVKGNYALEWRGEPVKYAFFVHMLYPGILCCLLATLARPRLFRWAVIAFASVVPIATIVFLTRRFYTVYFALIVALCIFFVRKWAPPRWLAISGTLALAAWLVIAPEIRSYMPIGADRSQLERLDLAEPFEELVTKGQKPDAMRCAVVLMPAYDHYDAFYWGRGWWNFTIASFVPRQWVGEEFKESLMFPVADRIELAAIYAGDRISPYSTISGTADAFREFWYLGCLPFYVIGAAFRALWERARAGSVGAQVTYIALATQAINSVASQLADSVPATILVFLTVGPVIWYSRRAPASGEPGLAPLRGPAPAAPAAAGEG